jgi:hypothetical protein
VHNGGAADVVLALLVVAWFAVDGVELVAALVALDAALVTVVVTVFELPQPATATAAASATVASAVPRVLVTRIGVCSATAARILPASCDDPR